MRIINFIREYLTGNKAGFKIANIILSDERLLLEARMIILILLNDYLDRFDEKEREYLNDVLELIEKRLKEK